MSQSMDRRVHIKAKWLSWDLVGVEVDYRVGRDYFCSDSTRPRIGRRGGGDSVFVRESRERNGHRREEEGEVRVGVTLLYGGAHFDYMVSSDVSSQRPEDDPITGSFVDGQRPVKIIRGRRQARGALRIDWVWREGPTVSGGEFKAWRGGCTLGARDLFESHQTDSQNPALTCLMDCTPRLHCSLGSIVSEHVFLFEYLHAFRGFTRISRRRTGGCSLGY